MLLLVFSASSAQESPWRVILSSGDTLTACRLDSLHNNVLSGTCDIKAFSFSVDSIAALVQHKEGSFWTGALIGSLVGAATGAAFGAIQATDYTSAAAGGGGIIGAVGGFVVGGIIGASSSHETYDLTAKTLNMKLQIIKNLLPK
jgi:hypothetical protein